MCQVLSNCPLASFFGFFSLFRSSRSSRNYANHCAGCLGIGSPIPSPIITQHSMSKPKQQQVVAYLALPLADAFALAPAFGVALALAFPSGVRAGRCLFRCGLSGGGALAKRFCRVASVRRDLWQWKVVSC